MKDYFGVELELGMEVVYVYCSGSSVVKTLVTVQSFTEKMVRVVRKDYTDWKYTVAPSSLIVRGEYEA